MNENLEKEDNFMESIRLLYEQDTESIVNESSGLEISNNIDSESDMGACGGLDIKEDNKKKIEHREIPIEVLNILTEAVSIGQNDLIKNKEITKDYYFINHFLQNAAKGWGSIGYLEKEIGSVRSMELPIDLGPYGYVGKFHYFLENLGIRYPKGNTSSFYDPVFYNPNLPSFIGDKRREVVRDDIFKENINREIRSKHINIHLDFSIFKLNDNEGGIENIPAIEISQIPGASLEEEFSLSDDVFLRSLAAKKLVRAKVEYLLEKYGEIFEKSFELNENKPFFYIRAGGNSSMTAYGVLLILFDKETLSYFKNKKGDVIFNKIYLQLVNPREISSYALSVFREIAEYNCSDERDNLRDINLLKIDMHIWDFKNNINRKKYISSFCVNSNFRCCFYNKNIRTLSVNEDNFYREFPFYFRE